MTPERLLLTCEHGGHRVPRRWAPLFRGAEGVLGSHRGWDPGALPLARLLSRRLGAPLLAVTVTRLLVEVNRSPGHPRLFSGFTRGLPPEEREAILARHYRPHRERVLRWIQLRLRRPGRVVHVGVHSFTPVLDGVRRELDVGLLYDPGREGERTLCARWRNRLREVAPALRVRRNAPYRGTADGLVTALRRQLPEDRYLGIELEVNQALLHGPRRATVSATVSDTFSSLRNDKTVSDTY